MEKNIVKNGTKVILFALDTEGDLDNLMRKDFEVVPNKFINLTPHTITLNNGTKYHPSGKVARVENQFSNFCCGISTVFYGEA